MSMKLVDIHGRAIPQKNMNVARVSMVQPLGNYTNRLARLKRHFTKGMTFVSPREFRVHSAAILERVKGDTQIANLVNGVYLPICIPQMTVADYGTALEETFLSAVSSSYSEQFPNRLFNNNRKGKLAGKVTVVPKTRHQHLIEKMAQGPVVGIYFPMAFPGFRVDATHQMIQMFPDDCTLSGALDISVAMVAYPDILARRGPYPPHTLICAAVTYVEGERPPSFHPHYISKEENLGFGATSPCAYYGSSGGVLVLG